LLDNTEKVHQAAWEGLERQLIEPLISVGRGLVIIAGRRQVPRWRRFEVRRRTMEPRQSLIRPFDKQAVTMQLEHANYHIPVDFIFPYTAGSPYLVDTIARQLIAWAVDEPLDQGWLEQQRDNLLLTLRASEEQLLGLLSPALLRVLDAISPLRFY